jgi:site-specific recombinase XerD
MEKEDFKTYLENKKYVKETVNYYYKNALYYENWLEENKLNLTEANYTDLMNYIGFLQEQGKSNVMINKHLKSIELYYNYKEISNIAHNVRVKSSKQEAKLYLNEKDINTLYKQYEIDSNNYYKYSDKILLSFIIYQSLELKELVNLKLENIDLEKGTIYIASGKYLKNSRIVKLEAHQIIPLHTYITSHREQGEQLFLPQSKALKRLAKQLGQIHKSLMIQTKELEFKYQSLKQLRQSRIVCWIKQYGLREAQYLSGHKGIDSIERYQSEDIEDLSKQIEKLHPMG